MMRTDGVLEFFVNNDAGTLCARASDEQHHTGSSIRVESLQGKRWSSSEVMRMSAYL